MYEKEQMHKPLTPAEIREAVRLCSGDMRASDCPYKNTCPAYQPDSYCKVWDTWVCSNMKAGEGAELDEETQQLWYMAVIERYMDPLHADLLKLKELSE